MLPHEREAYIEGCKKSRVFYEKINENVISFTDALGLAVIDDDPYIGHYIQDFLVPEDENGELSAQLMFKFLGYVNRLDQGQEVKISNPDATRSDAEAIAFEMEISLLESAKYFTNYKNLLRDINRIDLPDHEWNSGMQAKWKLCTRHLIAAMLHRVRFEALTDASKLLKRINKTDEKNLQNANANSQSSGRTKERILDLFKYYYRSNAASEANQPKYVFTTKGKLCEQLSIDFLKSSLTDGLGEEFFEKLNEDHERQKLKIESKVMTTAKKAEKKALNKTYPDVSTHKTADESLDKPDVTNAGHKPETLSDLIKANESAWAEYVSQLVPPKNSEQKILEKKE